MATRKIWLFLVVAAFALLAFGATGRADAGIAPVVDAGGDGGIPVAAPAAAPSTNPTADAGSSGGAGTAGGETVNAAKKPSPDAWEMLLVYFVLPAAIVFFLHFYDSKKGYVFAAETRKMLLDKLGGGLTADQVMSLSRELTPTGMAGTTRSIFTYGLLILLGTAVFHLLAFSSDTHALEYADKTLGVLSGALSAIIGFYFGSKAMREGVETGGSQAPEIMPPPRGKITGVEPPKAKRGEEITIVGIGFGDTRGSVEFNGESVPTTEDWMPTRIRVRVPESVPKGSVMISANPSKGNKIVGVDVPFEVVP
jgi:hypothetical protein